MSLLVVAAVVLAYLCIVTVVMALLVSAKRADAKIEDGYRTLLRQRAKLDGRRVAGEEERPAPRFSRTAEVAQREPAELPRSGDR